MVRTSTRLANRASNRISHSYTSSRDKNQTRSSTKRREEIPIVTSSSDSEYSDLEQELLAARIPRTPTKQKSHTSEAVLNHISPVTPPKQLKQSMPQTPSTLLKSLRLTSPKAKDNITSTKQDSNRKKLFKEQTTPKNDSDALSSEENKDDQLQGSSKSIFQNARQALHSSLPSEMPGREKEHQELREFIKEHLDNRTSASMYISGPPGTGKTASLNVILQEEEFKSSFLQVYINCTAIKSANSVYGKLIKELKIKSNGKSEKDNLLDVENYLRKSRKMILLVLDEIDQLETKNQSILYTIFEWPSKPNSHLILIGIANALDLTDRTLPRLQAKCGLQPKLMHFAPYSKQQITAIFTYRLKSAGAFSVFSPIALQLLAAKVAAVSGDVRRALDIGRRVIEVVERNKKEDVLKPIENLAEAIIESERKKNDTVEQKQVLDVLNNVYGTSQTLLSEDKEDTMPLQQKIIICCVLLLKKSKAKDITIGKLHEVYIKVCKKRNILSVDQTEFFGLCSLIETRGMIRVTGKKERRFHKVSLEWNEAEVSNALKDKQLMSSILEDVSCFSGKQ